MLLPLLTLETLMGKTCSHVPPCPTADAADHDVFAAHRTEAGKLAGALADDHVQLVPLSYRDVWAHWEQLDDAEIAEHVAAVRARYDVSLGPIA